MGVRMTQQLKKHQIGDWDALREYIVEQAIVHGFEATGTKWKAMDTGPFDRVYLTKSDRIWGDEATVDLNLWHSEPVEVDGKTSLAVQLEVQISWSSTHRSLAQAMVAVANYQAAIQLVAALTAFAEGRWFVLGGQS